MSEALRDKLQYIVGLSAGWDGEGSLGPREPYSWETVARMAMDLARAGLNDLAAQSEQSAAPLAAKEAPPVAGWQLVPIEPTQAMCEAPSTVIQSYGAKLIYQRMLAAAPVATAMKEATP